MVGSQEYRIIINETNQEKIINYSELLSLKKENNNKFKKTDEKYIKSRSGKNIIEELEKNKIITLIEEKKEEKQKKEKNSKINSRLTTMQNDAIKDYINKHYEKTQPKFTNIDKNKKIEIWGCPSGTSCFSDDKCSILKGDHIYGIREGIKDHDIIGSDSLWNMIPCTHKENMTWKKSFINKIKKNIVYDSDDISEEDLKKLSSNEIDLYNKFKEWKKYCEERGAKLFWKNGRKIDKYVQEIVKKSLSKLTEDIYSLEKVSEDKEDKLSDKEKEEYNNNYINTNYENQLIKKNNENQLIEKNQLLDEIEEI